MASPQPAHEVFVDPLASPQRLSFPDDEARQPWLALLLEGYHVTDQGVAEGVRREQAQGRHLACHRGCAACCRTHRTIPVYPLELIGLYWYCTEKLGGELRARIKEQLRRYRQGEPCPFLVDDACGVHPLRPMACRQFNVFERVCAEGEDAYYTRRADVLTPLADYTERAFDAMLPFYGVTGAAERKRALKEGRLHAYAKVLQELDWPALARRMDEHDAKRVAAKP
jgi:Fe-S-cluster containining protein